jgi:hypothetical protein
MTNWTRIWLSLSLAGVVAAGVAHQRLDEDRKRQRRVAAECNRCVEAPGRRGKVLHRRLAAKAAVVRQLLDGRLTLLEAAEWFKVLNEMPSDCPSYANAVFPTGSEGETLCRQVISWTEGQLLMQSPSQAEAVTRELKEELQAYLERDGIVRLPGE